MAAFDPTHVKVGPGTLYAAPLGTAEPTSVTGAWPAGWTELGYTDQGSQFSLNPATANVEVEEELIPTDVVSTGLTATLTFALAETTRQNFLLAMNAGIGTGLVAGTSGTEADGSLWAEPPDLGTEARIMLGWDALPKGATSGTDPFSRLVARKCFQTGNMSVSRRKGNNKAVYSCTFTLQKPTGLQPFRFWFPPQLGS